MTQNSALRFGQASKLLLLLCILFVTHSPVSSQSPYQLKWQKELTLFGGSALIGAGSLFLQKRLEPLSVGEIEKLKISSVPHFDRRVTKNYSKKAGRFSDHLQIVGFTLPALLLVDGRSRKDFYKISVMLLEGLALTSGITTLTKVSTRRNRPFVYNDNVPLKRKTVRQARKSFFSGHTSVNSFMFFFTARVIADYSQNRFTRIAAWSVAAGIPAIMAYLRVRSGNHFITDVMVGYGVGAAFGLLLPRIHQIPRISKLTLEPELFPGYSGLNFTYALN